MTGFCRYLADLLKSGSILCNYAEEAVLKYQGIIGRPADFSEPFRLFSILLLYSGCADSDTDDCRKTALLIWIWFLTISLLLWFH
jgi:hypothetical protein